MSFPISHRSRFISRRWWWRSIMVTPICPDIIHRSLWHFIQWTHFIRISLPVKALWMGRLGSIFLRGRRSAFLRLFSLEMSLLHDYDLDSDMHVFKSDQFEVRSGSSGRKSKWISLDRSFLFMLLRYTVFQILSIRASSELSLHRILEGLIQFSVQQSC